MSAAYRDENESLQRRIEELERELARRPRMSRAWPAVTLAALAVALVASGSALMTRHAQGAASLVLTPPATPVPAAIPGAPAAPADLCATPGVHVTIDGADAFAPAVAAGDRAGQKYRKDGSRAPWLTVNGPLRVHAWGDALASDTGTSKLTMLDLVTRGEEGGYRLARDGRSVLEITRADDAHLVGRFEADVSKVKDLTREAPFGTPVVRARGSFCLARLPANPADTGP